MTWLFQLHDATQKAHNDKCENWKRIHNAVEDVIVAISTYSLVLGEPASWSTGVTPPPPQKQDKLTRYYLVFFLFFVFLVLVVFKEQLVEWPHVSVKQFPIIHWQLWHCLKYNRETIFPPFVAALDNCLSFIAHRQGGENISELLAPSYW